MSGERKKVPRGHMQRKGSRHRLTNIRLPAFYLIWVWKKQIQEWLVHRPAQASPGQHMRLWNHLSFPSCCDHRGCCLEEGKWPEDGCPGEGCPQSRSHTGALPRTALSLAGLLQPINCHGFPTVSQPRASCFLTRQSWWKAGIRMQ